MFNNYNEFQLNNAGIYKIINNINNKVYYGSTISFKIRWQTHIQKLNFGNHDNKHLQSAWKLYGAENFSFLIVETILRRDNATDETFKEYLLSREQNYLEQYWDNGINCYNVYKIAGNSLGYKHTDETKAKMSLKKKNKRRPCSESTKIKISIANKGTILTEEHKKKLSASKIGKKRKLFTQEHLDNMSRARTGIKHTEDTIEKIMIARKKQSPPMLGKKHSIETKNKMSKNRKGRIPSNKGKKCVFIDGKKTYI